MRRPKNVRFRPRSKQLLPREEEQVFYVLFQNSGRYGCRCGVICTLLSVGHTDEDTDQAFRRTAVHLRSHNANTRPKLQTNCNIHLDEKYRAYAQLGTSAASANPKTVSMINLHGQFLAISTLTVHRSGLTFRTKNSPLIGFCV